MWTAIVTAASNGLAAVGGWFNWASQRMALKNTATMQANAQAVQDQKTKDRITADVASGDVTAIEKDIAE